MIVTDFPFPFLAFNLVSHIVSSVLRGVCATGSFACLLAIVCSVTCGQVHPVSKAMQRSKTGEGFPLCHGPSKERPI